MECNVTKKLNCKHFILVKHGCASLSFLHLPNILGKSALHWAAAVNNVEATLVLLKNGANRDMQDNKVGCCVFISAISNQNKSNCSFVCVLIKMT